MSPATRALKVLLSTNFEYCCVCLESLGEEAVYVHDEIFFNTYNNENNLTPMFDVMLQILGSEINLSANDGVCQNCSSTLISSYKFIKMCEENQMALKSVTESIQNSSDLLCGSDHYKTLFLSLNPYDYTSYQYFDDKKPTSNLKLALNRFKSFSRKCKKEIKLEINLSGDELVNDQLYEELDDSTLQTQRKKKNKHKGTVPSLLVSSKKHYVPIPIATTDMVCDVNNLQQPKCKGCKQEFKGIDSLRQHYIRVHAPKVFECSECPRSYGSAGLLSAHQSESHVTVVCSQCGKTFYNRSTLKQHELSHQKSIICQDCGRVYKNKNTYKHHKETEICKLKSRRSQKNAQYECDICKKRYSQKASLRVHMRFEHGNAEYHICSWCGKKFVAPSKLKTHILTHTQEKNFPCNICGGKFVSKESLVYHTRTHTGETPYSCDYCDSKFLSMSRCTEHIKRHHSQPEECDICHIKFKSIISLHKHRKRHFDPKSRLLCKSQEFQD